LAALIPGLREKMATPTEHDKAAADNELNRLKALNKLQVEVVVKNPNGQTVGKSIKASENAILMYGD
jgi:hypothetical protein